MEKKKTKLTDLEKMDTFFNWLKKETNHAKNSTIGSASGLLWGRYKSMEKVLRKYKTIFKSKKI